MSGRRIAVLVALVAVAGLARIAPAAADRHVLNVGDSHSALTVSGAIERFRAAHPRRVQVAEWDDLARAHPEWKGDGVHHYPSGYAARRELVRDAVRRGRH